MAYANQNGSASTYACDCGEEYMTEETLRQHQQTKCKNRSISCSFCQDILPSSVALRQHLILCGNKTDECPKCRRLIRRSHFTYHYENNCASIDEIETPPSGRRSRTPQRSPINLNRPASREDIPNDDYRENHLGQHPSMLLPRVNGRIQSPVINPRNSPVLIECEYCHSQCAQKDYKAHRENCLRNPANINYKQSPRLPFKPNQNQAGSKSIVHLPCEICHQPVDLPNWSTHMQSCRERELQRVKSRARSMSQEPVTELIPCEYCQQLCTAKQIHPHENNCPRNPENVDSAAKLARPRPAPSAVILPMRKKQPEDHIGSSNGRSPRNQRNVHYQSIDIDLTHAANRSSDNGRSNNHVNANHYPVRRSSSNDYLEQSGKSRRDDHTYENTPIRLNGDRSYENESQPHKYRSPNGSLQRKQSSYANERNFNDDRDQDVALREDRTLYHENRKHQHRLSGKSRSYEVINNDADHPSTKKHPKGSWFKRFFCGLDTTHASN